MSTLQLFHPTGALKEISATGTSAATELPTFSAVDNKVAITASGANVYGVFGGSGATAANNATGGFVVLDGTTRGFTRSQDDTHVAIKTVSSTATVWVETGSGC